MRVFLVLMMLFLLIPLYGQEKIEAIHNAVEEATEGEAIEINTNLKNSYLANEVFLIYKSIDDLDWTKLVMNPKDGSFYAKIPKKDSKGSGIHYFIQVITLEEDKLDVFASKESPQFIKLKSNNNVIGKIETSVEDKQDKVDEDFFKDEFEVFKTEEEVTVKLASGKEESLFDSPLSASVLTASEIKKSGATSIPEALRLVPGVIVREQTSGNYDIHIRGFDYVPPKAYLPFSSNSTTLLMINNRILYNYIQGGIYWEAIPVDISDVERIEIIRGAASAMYGPNAASGVINIITKDFAKKKEKSFLNVRLSKGDTTDITDSKKGDVNIVNAIMGLKKGKAEIIVSGNYTERKRISTQYWAWRNGEVDEDGIPKGDWVDNAGDIKAVDYEDKTMDETDNTNNQFPDQTLALRKYGLNLFMIYDLKKDIKFSLDLGAQSSDSQKAFLETLDSFLSGGKISSQYINFKSNVFDGELHIAYKSESEKAYNYPSFSYDSKVLNMILKYDFNLFGLNIRPLLNYNNIRYSGKGFGGENVADATIENLAGSLRFDYTLLDTLRLIAAGRIDKYAHNDKYIFTFQLASTVNIMDFALLRAVYSRANRNPFLSDNFYLVRNLNEDEPRVFIGNPDLDVLTMDMIELGVRLKLSKILVFDLEAFYTTSENYDDVTFTGQIVVIDGVSRAKVGFENMSLIAKQKGITASLDFKMNIVNLKLFGTVQKTDIENYNDNFLMNPKNEDLQTLEHKNTPRFYGGAYLNIKATKDLNININPYYYSSQVFIHNLGTTDINSKFILNAKVEYKFNKELSVYFNGRNILNDKSREFGFADQIGGLYLLGVNINY